MCWGCRLTSDTGVTSGGANRRVRPLAGVAFAVTLLSFLGGPSCSSYEEGIRVELLALPMDAPPPLDMPGERL